MTPTPTQKSFTLDTSGGPVTITMRKPTSTEVLAYMDKRSLLKQGIRPSADACDDGDYELTACVTSPSAAQMEALRCAMDFLPEIYASQPVSGSAQVMLRPPMAIID